MARGHIGETPEQCRAEYGASTQPQTDVLVFKSASFSLIITFYEGKADAIVYQKVDTDDLGDPVDIPVTEINQLLRANAGGRVWKKSMATSLDPTWETEDGELSARYIKFKHYLAILTKGYAERADAAEKAEGIRGLKDF